MFANALVALKGTNDANLKGFFDKFLSENWPRRGASLSMGEDGYDLLEPRVEWKEEMDDSDEVEARRERVPLESSTAEVDRERLNVGFHFQLHGLHPRTSTEELSGWLYNQVATRTTVEPRMNVSVIWKLNSATEARKEITMERLVANPLRMLSAYLMTNAVSRPPNT